MGSTYHTDKIRAKYKEIKQGKEDIKKAGRPRVVDWHKITMGFDQSYTNTGIALVGQRLQKAPPELIYFESLPTLKRESRDQKIMSALYREALRKRIIDIVGDYRYKALNYSAIFEAIRVFSQGNMQIRNHLKWGALAGSIVDTLWQEFEIYTYMVDTRQWKSKTIGTSKPAEDEETPRGVDPKKWPTIQYCMNSLNINRNELAIELGPKSRNWTWKNKNTETKYTYDTDKCDAIAIAMYGMEYGVKDLTPAF